MLGFCVEAARLTTYSYSRAHVGRYNLDALHLLRSCFYNWNLNMRPLRLLFYIHSQVHLHLGTEGVVVLRLLIGSADLQAQKLPFGGAYELPFVLRSTPEHND